MTFHLYFPVVKPNINLLEKQDIFINTWEDDICKRGILRTCIGDNNFSFFSWDAK